MWSDDTEAIGKSHCRKTNGLPCEAEKYLDSIVLECHGFALKSWAKARCYSLLLMPTDT